MVAGMWPRDRCGSEMGFRTCLERVSSWKRMWCIVGAGVLFAAGMLAQGIATRDAKPVARAKRSGRPFSARFVERGQAAGMTAKTVYGDAAKKLYIIETNGGGVAWIDYDGDGLLDAFLSNGSTLDGDSGAASQLYKNLGDGKFMDVAAKAGVARAGWGNGVCAGDFDNDGAVDLFVGYWGLNSLYRNLGDGRFEDIAVRAGVGGPAKEWTTGCTFADYDRDGDLDLFTTQYQQFDPKTTPAAGSGANCQWKGMPTFCGPRGLPYGGVTLYRNEGGGKFADVSTKAAIRAGQEFYAFTAMVNDLDGDGWADLYVACDSTPNLFFVNNGDGTFSDFAAETGLGFNEHGFEQGGMGLGVGDFNRDGMLDIVKTNFAGDYPNVYLNTGDGIFEDVVIRAGLAVNPQFVGWGVELVDVDNDGWQDVVQVNGHVYAALDEQERIRERYRQTNVVYRNLGTGKFEDVTDLAGPGFAVKASSRGAAFGDYDNDGDMDVLVMNLGEAPSLLENRLESANHWIRFELEGVTSNRSAIGSTVTVYTGDDVQTEAVLSQSSFLSHNDLRVHFGLGDAEGVDKVVVRWPNGNEETFGAAKGGKTVKLKEGTGK